MNRLPTAALYINEYHGNSWLRDFSWEREWRVRGDLKFTSRDIVCLILPADREGPSKERMVENGIAVISPAMARPKRFELLTPRFVVWCSIQLSYGRLPFREGSSGLKGAKRG